MQSASPWAMNSAAICSSSLLPEREYVPGRSISSTQWPRNVATPDTFPTVFPGQLPVCWRKPVSALNSVDLPTLGFPANAIFIGLSCALIRHAPECSADHFFSKRAHYRAVRLQIHAHRGLNSIGAPAYPAPTRNRAAFAAAAAAYPPVAHRPTCRSRPDPMS